MQFTVSLGCWWGVSAYRLCPLLCLLLSFALYLMRFIPLNAILMSGTPFALIHLSVLFLPVYTFYSFHYSSFFCVSSSIFNINISGISIMPIKYGGGGVE